MIVPPAPGLFSSFGLLYADVEHHYARTFRRLLRGADLAEIEAAWADLARQATAQLAVEGFTGRHARLRRSGAMHYKGQSFELVVPVPDGPFDAAMVAHLEEAFGREHEKTYGHRAGPEEPVELVSIQVVGQGLREGTGVPQRALPRRLRDGAQPAAPRLLRGNARLARDADPETLRSGDDGGLGRSSSRNTTPPASSHPERRPSSTPAATLSSSLGDSISPPRRATGAGKTHPDTTAGSRNRNRYGSSSVSQ